MLCFALYQEVMDAKFDHSVDVMTSRSLHCEVYFPLATLYTSYIPAPFYLMILTFINDLCLNHWFKRGSENYDFVILLWFLSLLTDVLLLKKNSAFPPKIYLPSPLSLLASRVRKLWNNKMTIYSILSTTVLVMSLSPT